MQSNAETKPKVVYDNKTRTHDKLTVNKKKKSRFFETYISKVLKQVSEHNGITCNSKQQLNSCMCIITREISRMVIKLTEIAKKKTMSDKEVSNAVGIMFSGDLATNSIREGEKSVSKFNEKTSKGSSRQGKAGIIFPPSIAEKFLRNFGYSKIMVTSTAPVFLASVLEYLATEILILSSKSATNNKRIRITIRDIQLSIGEDKELSDLFKSLNVSLIGGGVIPYIHPTLISKKPRKKKKIVDSKNGIKKPHRFRPGTVALREIKKFQKTSNCLIFAKFPFERLVRSIVKTKKDGMKISKDVFIIIQYYIEQYIVDILKDANNAAIHAGRVKLMRSDIEFICNIRRLSVEGFSDNPKKKTKSKLKIDNVIETDNTHILTSFINEVSENNVCESEKDEDEKDDYKKDEYEDEDKDDEDDDEDDEDCEDEDDLVEE
jgi:histone H3/H4